MTNQENVQNKTRDEKLDEAPAPSRVRERRRISSFLRTNLWRAISRRWDLLTAWAQRFYECRIVEGIFLRRELERFYMVFGGHIFFQTLHAAVRFDLFSLLDEHPGLTQDQMAFYLKVEAQPLRILLLGLTSAGLIKKWSDRYWNTTISKRLLTKSSPRQVIPYVLLQNGGMYKAMPYFYQSMKENRNVGLEAIPGTEPTFYQRLAHDPDLAQIFQDAMQALSVQANELLAKFLDLSHVKHIVDVGGGDGSNAMALARKNPTLRATVFDLPNVCEIANRNIAEHKLTHRVEAIPGECFKDPFPHGADAILFSHFFTIWSEAKDRALLKKAFKALPSGGRVIIFNMMQNDDRSGPLSAAVGSPYFLTLATGEGMLYTWQEYETWMREAGFTKVFRFRLPIDHGVIVGIKE